MRKLLLLTAAVAAAFVAGCGGAATADDAFGFSTLRVINLAPGSGNIDFSYAGQALATALPYGGAAPQTNQAGTLFESGTDSLVVRWFGASGKTLTQSLAIDPNRRYTAVFVGQPGNTGTNAPRVLVLNDAEAGLYRGQTNLRLIHAATGTGAVDVYFTADNETITEKTPNFAGFTRYSSTGLLHFPAGAWKVWVTPVGSKTRIYSSTLQMEEGLYGTMTAVSDGEGALGFQYHVGPIDAS
jgi:hypothetical protein